MAIKHYYHFSLNIVNSKVRSQLALSWELKIIAYFCNDSEKSQEDSNNIFHVLEY